MPRFMLSLMAAATLLGPPDPAQASTQDTATTEFSAAGVRVIHRYLAANDLVAVNVYLLGGSAQLDAATAGIELMLLHASEFGTGAYPGRETRLAMARTGSRTDVETRPDWTLFGFRGVSSEFDSSWNVFADRIMDPALDPADVEIVRSRMLRAARSRRSHPDALLGVLADSVAFAGHVYAHDPKGSIESLTALTPAMLREYHAAQVVRSRMLVVVVGNVSRAQVEAAVQRTFAHLPAGSYRWSLPPTWPALKASVTSIPQQLPTNYVLGYYAGPRSDSRDYLPFLVATRILGGVAGATIREAGLSYAPAAPFLERGASGGGIYVSTVRADTTMKIFNSSVEWMREMMVNRADLQRYLRGFITEYHSNNESVEGQADFLARYELLRGDWRAAGSYMTEMRAMSNADIRRAARQYIRNIQYVYIGNTERVPTAVMTKY
jgi:zinc protease